MKYFAYSDEHGFSVYETAEKAKKAAHDMIRWFASDAEDGWSESVESVCWGEIVQMAGMLNNRMPERGSMFDYICDYTLKDVEP